MQEGKAGFLRKVKRFFTQSLNNRTDSQTDQSRTDTCHTKNLLERILLLEENQPIGKTDDRTATADRADDGDQRVRIAEGQHIDIVRDDQKERDEGDR